MLLLHRDLPCLGDFVRIAGTQHQHVRHRPQPRQLLDWLMRRSILANTNRIVRHHVNHGGFHQRRQPHRWFHVIGEVKEGRVEHFQTRDCHAVRRRSHAVFANSEVEVASSIVVGLKIARARHLQVNLVRFRQISRASDQPRNVLRESIQNFSRAFPSGNAFGVGREGRQILVPSVRQSPCLNVFEFGGQLGELLRILGEPLHP